MKNLSFVKFSGAGNDFIIIDKASNPEIVLTNNVISLLCNRRNGVGADGIIVISDLDGFDFVMDYFNADGSTGTLCGNGARCAIKFAQNTNRVIDSRSTFLSNGVEYSGELLGGGLVKFNLNPPKTVMEKFQIEYAGFNIPASFIDTGSPHVVIDVDDLKARYPNETIYNQGLYNVPVISIGREIRNKPEFAPFGVNVNFIELFDEKINIRTYERGVEDETLACGTGAVAGAIIGSGKYGINPPVRLITRGKDELVVHFKVEGSEYKNVSLTGPVKEIYNGEISINIFS
jgi:diaminopimelate epimerase